MIHPLIKQAQERRKNNGSWIVSIVVVGYDDIFKYEVPGSLDKQVAGAYAKYYVFRDLRPHDRKLKLDMVVVKDILRDGIEKKGYRRRK